MRDSKSIEVGNMINLIETYIDAGTKAGDMARKKDYRASDSIIEHTNRMLSLETQADRKSGHKAFDEAYREASGFKDKPQYFL